MALFEDDYLKAQDILTLPPEAPAIEALDSEATTAVDKARPWISGPQVVGTGVAPKITGGKRIADQLALVVYVKDKRAPNDLSPTQTVPSTVQISTFPEPIVTDVVAIGELRLQLFNTRVRPLVPAYSGGLIGDATGTLGCWVAKTTDPSKPLALSNSHVLAQFGLAAPGAPVIQPSKDDGGGSVDVVAAFTEAVPFDFTPGFNNLCDAAIATLEEGVLVTPEIPRIGAPQGTAIDPAVGMHIQKCGRTTGHTTGVIQDVHFRTTMLYPKPGGGVGSAGFREQVLCSRYSDGGDSGSLVCDMNGAPVGLHWCGSIASSIFSPISFVFELLKVQVWSK